MLRLEHVGKSFQHQGNLIDVLKDINLEISPGDSLAIMGASGVGKSTLLNIMGSLDPPTRGIVSFRDKNIYQMDEAELCSLRNREIGFVFQFHYLLPELNALENCMMPALIARYPRKRALNIATDVLKKVGLENRLSHRAGELSGGEQQRTAIARALIMNPSLILADEPTGNLDWSTGQEVGDLLTRLNEEEEMAMVIVTHNLRLAEKMERQFEIVDGGFSEPMC
ncbi:MAG: ABC transporter ATP-binding protein [Deltaproteobacteria bacterium]|nr:ABC transporter ATP-binding protein [Deltaproteobacteria bacterium]